ncbi:FtsK/SpoIIIE domain-containing protein [Peribacillus asahii]|uniref:FtsK/SpoIIIE domain-containing protein n=1 Tax=Peribacillus asahii TaxID=228899 RepID=UPI00207975F0|nr:FtsK/SpoIIIE domain-containing protein [Peribacillus asahii]USK85747.1 cell division protein FtsK [Peribacillus asahii]
MIEWLAIPAIALGAALVPKGKMDDKQKIQKIFENRKIGINKGDSVQYPKLINTHTNETYTTYIYSLPLGIPSEALKNFSPVLKDGLNKDVEIEFEGVLKVKVFENNLPKSWKYDDTLLMPSTWSIPVGKNHEGILYHDFEHYPHMLVGGVTRFGKTVFIKEAFYSLLMNQPEHVEFYVLDLKGGLEFGKYEKLPQVKAVASDVYEAADVLNQIVLNLKIRQKAFREKGYTNIVDTPIKKRTFVIVDEGAELSPNIVTGDAKPYAKFCQSALSEIARIGGGLGLRLLYCTQYPTKEAVPMQVKMNIVARISFVAAAQISSVVILDEPGAEDLPSIPGRAIYKVEKNRTIQVPYITDKYISKKLEWLENDVIQASENRKSTNDDRPIEHGENTSPSTNS